MSALLHGLFYIGPDMLSLPDIKKKQIYIVIIGMIISVVRPNSLTWVKEYFTPKPIYGLVVAIILIFILLEVGKGSPSDFIYFQF